MDAPGRLRHDVEQHVPVAGRCQIIVDTALEPIGCHTGRGGQTDRAIDGPPLAHPDPNALDAPREADNVSDRKVDGMRQGCQGAVVGDAC